MSTIFEMCSGVSLQKSGSPRIACTRTCNITMIKKLKHSTELHIPYDPNDSNPAITTHISINYVTNSSHHIQIAKPYYYYKLIVYRSLTHPKLFFFNQIKMSINRRRREAGEELEEPRNELCSELLGLHAGLGSSDNPLVVLHILKPQRNKTPNYSKTLTLTLETEISRKLIELTREKRKRDLGLVLGLVETLAELVELLDVLGLVGGVSC